MPVMLAMMPRRRNTSTTIAPKLSTSKMAFDALSMACHLLPSPGRPQALKLCLRRHTFSITRLPESGGAVDGRLIEVLADEHQSHRYYTNRNNALHGPWRARQKAAVLQRYRGDRT